MSDDGNHNDGTIGDSVYGAFVPPLTGERIVPYYISVTDEVGITVLDPPDAPAVTYSYSSFGCCVGLAGNVDDDPEDNVDLGDLTSLISFLFISFEPPACPEEANIDGDAEGLIDLSDLTRLIDYLFTSTVTAVCVKLLRCADRFSAVL